MVHFYFEGGAWCSSGATMADLCGLIRQFGPPIRVVVVDDAS